MRRPFERLVRSTWPLYPLGVFYLFLAVFQLATFPFGDPVTKWIQLTAGIVSLFLAFFWLRAASVRTKAQRKAPVR